MIEVDEALRLVLEAATPGQGVTVDLAGARGRVLTEAVHADRDFPPTDRSAMDGFAVRSADLTEAGRVLDVVGELRAGEAPAGITLGAGQAARIMTGAVVPRGADAVVMVEHTTAQATRDRVRIDETVRTGQNVRPRGQDRRRGERVLEAGRSVGAAEVAALASLGATRVRVFAAPDVAVLTTGNEIVEPDREPAEHQLRNSNGPAMLTQLAELGLEGRYLGIAPDEPRGLAAALQDGLTADVLLITGGVSVGEYDLVGRELAAAGMELLFHKVAMKPGKPVLAGRRRGCLVVGLPGNPVSAFVGFLVLVAPALRRMLGYRSVEPITLGASLAEALRVRPGRLTYTLARVAATGGRLVADPVPTSGSGDVLSLSAANAFIVTPREGADLAAGAAVDVLLWRDLR